MAQDVFDLPVERRDDPYALQRFGEVAQHGRDSVANHAVAAIGGPTEPLGQRGEGWDDEQQNDER